MTNAPLTIEASAPRMTVMFFGPSAASDETEMSMAALVGAADDIEPPYVGLPSKISETDAEVLNWVPAVMSSPPIVRIPLPPRGTRAANAGRVRFNPVELLGRTWISKGPAVVPEVTVINCA